MYVIEFAMEEIMSYTTTKIKFLKGPRGRSIRLIALLIKMLLYDHGVMSLESYNMSI